SDGLVQLFFRESAAGEDCFALLNSSDRIMSVSTVVVPEEGTLRPGFFIPSEDSLPGFAWTDDSVNGLVFVRKVLITDNAVYYFGDDASEATGTLSIMRYDLAPEFHKKRAAVQQEVARKKPVVKKKNVVRKKSVPER
ncbi:MAG: hypothetical protein ACKOKF_07110, partial [Bacteroidota bacterium]